MKRRHFLLYTAMSAAAVGLPFIACNSAPDPVLDKKLSIPETLASLYDEKTIREIGTSYGKQHPEEYEIKTLEKLLRKNVDGISITAATAEKDIRSSLGSLVKKDFSSGDTVIVNGWILSVTEARQCALLTLLPTP